MISILNTIDLVFMCKDRTTRATKSKTAIACVEGGNWNLECKKPHKLK